VQIRAILQRVQKLCKAKSRHGICAKVVQIPAAESAPAIIFPSGLCPVQGDVNQFCVEPRVRLAKPFHRLRQFNESLAHSIERTFKITVSLGETRRGKPYVPIVADL
jgi:hypothetical protein